MRLPICQLSQGWDKAPFNAATNGREAVITTMIAARSAAFGRRRAADLLRQAIGDSRGMIGRTSEGDIYAGKDGNVYKRDQSGNWSQRGENGWNSVDTSKLSAEQQQRMNDAKTRQSDRQSGRQTSGTQTGRTQPGTLGTGRHSTRADG